MIHVRISKQSEYSWPGFNPFRILQIFYRCPNDREYELFLRGGYRDSVSDTCDHGQWVKKVKPICRESKSKFDQFRVNVKNGPNLSYQRNDMVHLLSTSSLS